MSETFDGIWHMLAEMPTSYWILALIGFFVVVKIIAVFDDGAADETAGLTQDGRITKTLIGRDEALILKPAGSRFLPFVGLAFFGGLSVAMAVYTLPISSKDSDWETFYALCAFTALSLFIYLPLFTRIRLTATTISRRSLWRPRFTARLEDLHNITATGNGLRLYFKGGRKLHVAQNMKGYHQLYVALVDDPEEWEHPHA